MILLIVIIFIAIVLFALDVVPADVIGIGIMVSLVVTGILTPEEGILGFGSETAIKTLGLLSILVALIGPFAALLSFTSASPGIFFAAGIAFCLTAIIL